MMGIKELENQNSSKGNFSNDVVFRNGLLFSFAFSHFVGLVWRREEISFSCNGMMYKYYF